MSLISFIVGVIVGYLIGNPKKRTQLVKAVVTSTEKLEEKQTAPKTEPKGKK